MPPNQIPTATSAVSPLDISLAKTTTFVNPNEPASPAPPSALLTAAPADNPSVSEDKPYQQKLMSEFPIEERTETRVRADTADILAIFSGLVAFLFAFAMIAGLVPIDKWTISVVTFTAVAPALAYLTKRGSRSRRKKQA
jgi:hypothetical protein